MGPGRAQTCPPPAHTAHTKSMLPGLLQSRIELELGRIKAPESPSMCRNRSASSGEGQGAVGGQHGPRQGPNTVPARTQSSPCPSPPRRAQAWDTGHRHQRPGAIIRTQLGPTNSHRKAARRLLCRPPWPAQAIKAGRGRAGKSQRLSRRP